MVKKGVKIGIVLFLVVIVIAAIVVIFVLFAPNLFAKWQYLKNEHNGLCANDVLSYGYCKDEDQFKWSNVKGGLRNKKSGLCLVLPDPSSNILTTSECNYDLPSHQWNLDASNHWMNKESEGVCVLKDGACLSG